MLNHILVFCLLSVTATLWSGCAGRGVSPDQKAQVSYFDTNHDQKVDLETHRYPGMADGDWELRDDDHNGRYEKKITFGFAVKQTVVDLPVPTDVPVHSKLSFDDPAVAYLRAYCSFKDAEKTNDRKESMRLLDDAAAYYQAVQEQLPDWKPSMVNARIQQTKELRTKLSTAEQ